MFTMATQLLRLWEACSAVVIMAFPFLSKWPRGVLLTHIREDMSRCSSCVSLREDVHCLCYHRFREQWQGEGEKSAKNWELLSHCDSALQEFQCGCGGCVHAYLTCTQDLQA